MKPLPETLTHDRDRWKRLVDSSSRCKAKKLSQCTYIVWQSGQLSDTFPGFLLEDVIWESLGDDTKLTRLVCTQSLVEQQ